jgi:hypothetical protein
MTVKTLRAKFNFRAGHSLLAILCVLSLEPGDSAVYAQGAQQQDASQEEEAPKIPNDQLDALVAPIALYPDPLLSQVLVASTYPLEINCSKATVLSFSSIHLEPHVLEITLNGGVQLGKLCPILCHTRLKVFPSSAVYSTARSGTAAAVACLPTRLVKCSFARGTGSSTLNRATVFLYKKEHAA